MVQDFLKKSTQNACGEICNCSQGLSQNFETGYPDLAVVKSLGVFFCKEAKVYLESNQSMYSLIKKMHNSLKQCQSSYI